MWTRWVCVSALWFAAISTAADPCPGEQRSVTHLAGTTCVPDSAQRIVSLHSLSLTIAVFELGAGDRLVGDVGVIEAGRGPMVHPITHFHTGLTYEEGTFEYLPWPLDFERIASLNPDLILGRGWELEHYDQLSRIAPTVMIDTLISISDVSQQVAVAINATDEKAALDNRFLKWAESVRDKLKHNEGIEVGFLTALYFDDLRVARRFHGMSGAMDAVGIKPAQSVTSFIERTYGKGTKQHRATLSPERLDVLDVDVLLLPFWSKSVGRDAKANSAQDDLKNEEIRARLEDKIPGFCLFLKACQNKQMIIFEGTPTYTPTYSGMMAGLEFIEREIVGRDFKRLADQ